MYRYGFELEAFYYIPGSDTVYNRLGIPPVSWPVDGFPGLVEIRTHGHNKLDVAYYYLFHEMRNHKIGEKDLRLIPSYKFSSEVRRELRRTRQWDKQQVDVRNIYDKKPRELGDRTIASFQINISNLVQAAYDDRKGVHYPDRFSLLDVPRIVKALDETFKLEIKEAGRQPGEYCIKGDRLEYRSLPNSVFQWEFSRIQILLNKINAAVEGV